MFSEAVPKEPQILFALPCTPPQNDFSEHWFSLVIGMRLSWLSLACVDCKPWRYIFFAAVFFRIDFQEILQPHLSHQLQPWRRKCHFSKNNAIPWRETCFSRRFFENRPFGNSSAPAHHTSFYLGEEKVARRHKEKNVATAENDPRLFRLTGVSEIVR
jgi:hypothetical protein